MPSIMIVTAQSEMEKKVIEIEVRKLDSLHAAAVLNGDLKEMDIIGPQPKACILHL
jgi:hypothetical protein